jgi:S-adenosylmethionine uptake transporter
VAAVLFSAVVFAYNLILARQQAQIAGPIEIAFFQNLLTASILALAAPWLLEPLPMAKLPILSGAALLAILSLLLLSWAYARAEAQVLIPVEYTGFVWAAIFGWLFFAEPVTVWTIAGTALIVAGSLVAARVKPQPINQVEMAST